MSRVLAAALLVAGCAGLSPGARHLDTAMEAAAWVRAQPLPASPSLYSGRAGVALFYIALHRDTGDATWRDLARQCLDDAKSDDPGLYTGEAGVAFALLELGERDRARAVADRLVEPRWGRTLDIISGAAGIGLFMLHAARVLDEPRYLDAAKRAGQFLLEHAIVDEPGLKWPVEAGGKSVYPNFSHGTAGVAYFLAALYERTRGERWLEAALKGAAWLKARGQGAWFHHEPDGRDLFYVGWCHGPAGTARLFHLLHRITRDDAWRDRVRECARWIMESDFRTRPRPGFWNNVSLCCGTAGVGDFFADVHAATGEGVYGEWAERMVRDLVARASAGAPGLKWVQAEHRVKPDDVRAQVGMMQGASGIGLFLLKMRGTAVRLPDSPF